MTSTRRNQPNRRGPAGFTVIEIMLVLALVGLIMGAVAHHLHQRGSEARKQVARLNVQDLAAMFFHHRLANNGDCPSIAQWIEDKGQANTKDDIQSWTF